MEIKKDIYNIKKFEDVSGGTCFALDPCNVNEAYIKINKNAMHILDILGNSALNLITGEIIIMDADKEVYLYENAEVITQ